jgi:hypothetical protein
MTKGTAAEKRTRGGYARVIEQERKNREERGRQDQRGRRGREDREDKAGEKEEKTILGRLDEDGSGLGERRRGRYVREWLKVVCTRKGTRRSKAMVILLKLGNLQTKTRRQPEPPVGRKSNQV